MMHPSTKTLLDRLAEMTRQRRIGWQETSSGTGVAYTTEGYSVHLVKEPQTLQLTDGNGAILEDVTSDEIAATATESGQSYTQVFEELFREAARQARGTERAIDAVLAGLDLDGDGIPDVPAPAQVSQQPTTTESDAGAYEDVADETGSVGTVVAAGAGLDSFTTTPEPSPAARAQDAEWASPAPTAPDARAEPAPQADMPGETAPATHHEATYETSVADDSANDVSEAVANMANEVNASQTEAKAEPQPHSGNGVLGGGGFGTVGFSGFGSGFGAPVQSSKPAPAETQAPEPEPEPEPQTQPGPFENQTAPAGPATATSTGRETAPQEASQTPVAEAEQGQSAWPPSSGFGQVTPAPAAYPARAEPQESTQESVTPTWGQPEAAAPAEPGHDEPAASDESVSQPYTPATPEVTPASVPQATATSPFGSTEPAPAPDATATASEGLSREAPASSEPGPVWGTPGEAAQAVAETADHYSESTAGVATEASEEAGGFVQQSVAAVDDTASRAVDAAGSTADAVTENVSQVASEAGETARTVASDAASSLASQAQRGQEAVGQVAGAATGAAGSLLGGASPQASGAANSLAGAATGAAGAAGQAVENVSNKLNPLGGQPASPKSETEEEGTTRSKPLTRFNPWS